MSWAGGEMAKPKCGVRNGIICGGKRDLTMMYPFLTLDDGTEITHSEKQDDASVRVYIEKADEKDCFHHATCYLPSYRWEDVFGFSKGEMERYQEVVESTAHLMLEFAETGGLLNASGF